MLKFFKTKINTENIEQRYYVIELLILFALSDEEIDSSEKKEIISYIKNIYPNYNEKSIFKEALAEVKSSTSFYKHISKINSEYSIEEKLLLLNDLWDLVKIDGYISKYEDNLFNRVGELLYIKRSEVNKIKNA